jgi:hypothetical protein
MKNIVLLFVLIITGFSACKVDNINPPIKTKTTAVAKADTSTTLYSNLALVGKWNIVTDTVSFLANGMYHGTAADHFIFTKYGNLYVNSGFNKQIDTAVYTITDNKLQWENSFWSVNGRFSYSATSQGYYTISNLTPTTLVLTQALNSPDGFRYEQITFVKGN